LSRFAERQALPLFSISSKAPTDLNSDQEEKLRESDWLISTILREINQLERGRVKWNVKHPG
jgi:hypothetical protein